MTEQIILIAGGGHCRSCIDVIEQEGRFAIAGIVDKSTRHNEQVLGYAIIADDSDLPTLIRKNYNFLITIGQIKNTRRRQDLFMTLTEANAALATVISPRAYVSRHAFIGPGTIIMHGAVVNAGAHIGSNCIINSQALVEHDAHVADHCHISTGALINGGVQIGAATFVGSQAMVREGVLIKSNCIIGAGTTILQDVEANSIIRV